MVNAFSTVLSATLVVRRVLLRVSVLLSCGLCLNAWGFCQENGSGSRIFELRAQGLDKPSIAELSDSQLVIRDPSGKPNVYLRLARYDTPDQRWLGYSSRELQQIIRWPASGSGNMQIGTLQQGKIQFSASRMSVHATNGAIGSDQEILPSIALDVPALPRTIPTPSQRPQPTMSQSSGSALPFPQSTPLLMGVGQPNRLQFLTMSGRDRLGLVDRAVDAMSAWYVTPVGNDMFRLQQRVQDNWMAIGLPGTDGVADSAVRLRGGFPPGASFGGGAFPRGGSFGGGGMRGGASMALGLYPIHGGCEQLWRINPFHSGGYCFESVLYPGMGLTCLQAGGLMLQPILYDPWQIWYPQQPIFTLPAPQFRTTQQQYIPNPPLAPTTATIANTHQDELLILFADRRNPKSPQKLRIPARGREQVQIERDAGGTIVENVEVVDAFGNWTQQQYTTPVPPTVLYDMSVYEVFLQSIAIDRTGTSPNPIEDVNYQPRSIGFFLIPPGDELPPNAVIDAYRVAQESDNQGAVRRLSERDLKGDSNANTSDPLKDILQKFQKQRAAF
jgi:hypothetical protein